ncbi:MAG: DUF488 domain-containing protein [Chthonomonadales bacterium]|nr:DUF488 domain-containing protein [Chthonomonadales bacterium]
MGEGQRPLVIYTVGHSNMSLDELLALLARHGVGVLADVRSQPYSRYTPHFSRDPLRAGAAASGIQYAFLGDALGGRPRELEYYDGQGHVLYGLVAASARFLAGLERLEALARERRVVILCGEESPAECHRRLLVGRVLWERGAQVLHLRADGRVQTEPDVRDEEAARDGTLGQLGLFDEDEVSVWRSTRSVSRGEGPGASSER